MPITKGGTGATYVTLHTEGVDRNTSGSQSPRVVRTVTLHTEGVDRNGTRIGWDVSDLVTLHTEGVDRNKESCESGLAAKGHPPHGGCG